MMTCTNEKLIFNEKLNKLTENHEIWDNLLLRAMEKGHLNYQALCFLFSQYYFYSKNFTRLLSALMIKCENASNRSSLIENLWDEAGQLDRKKSHSEIYRNFLKDAFHVNSLSDIRYEKFSIRFFEDYLQLCLDSPYDECLAILTFATEGIIAKLYSIFVTNLKKAGFDKKALEFFTLHISCDDEHAETLNKMLLDLSPTEDRIERCQIAINRALNLRDAFFSEIYTSIANYKINVLINRIKNSSEWKSQENEKFVVNPTDASPLYSNIKMEEGINFKVTRINSTLTVLDPRMLYIAPKSNNEMHRHPHESLFYVIQGAGHVIIDGKATSIKAGDIVFVPRWTDHQTHNTEDKALVIFAVTDFGLTKCVPGNTDLSYRKKLFMLA